MVEEGDPTSGFKELLWLDKAGNTLKDEAAARDGSTAWRGPQTEASIFTPSWFWRGEPSGEPPLIYARSDQGPGEPESFASLAALASKTIRVRLLPGLPWGISLRGRRLVGDQVLGDSTARASLDAFLDAAAWLLASGAVESPTSRTWKSIHPSERPCRKPAGKAEVAVFPLGRPQPHWWIRFPERPRCTGNGFPARPGPTFAIGRRAWRTTCACPLHDPEEVPVFLEKARQVSQETWQAKRLGPRITNSPQQRQFWELVASHGAMRSYILEQHGRPLAFVIGVQWQGRFIHEETGYALSYAACSPGTVMLSRLLEDLIARDTPRVLDFGTGDAEYKRHFGNHQTQSGPMLLVPRRWRPITALRLDRIRRGFSQCSAGLSRLSVLPVLRAFYRK